MSPEGAPPPCPICAGSLGAAIPYPGARPDGLLRCERIAVCRACGTGVALPQPSQALLDRFYASGAYWHASGGVGQRAHEANQARLRVGRLAPLLGTREALRVADVGAGHGGVARALAGAGLPVAALEFVEPDAAAAAEVQSGTLPFSVARRGSVAELAGDQDVVFLNHVLEHVADPVAFLGSVLAKLRPGGLAYVETPHADFRFKDDVFPHVFFFTRESARAMGERAGVATVAIEIFGRWLAPKWTPAGFAQRVAARGLAFSARRGWDRAAAAMDRALWGYRPDEAGIWLRWIFRRPA